MNKYRETSGEVRKYQYGDNRSLDQNLNRSPFLPSK